MAATESVEESSSSEDLISFTWKESLHATLTWSLTFTFGVLVLAWLVGAGTSVVDRVRASFELWSGSVIDHIGWALGAGFTALLGFLAVVAAVEYSGAARSRQIRKALSITAQIMAGAFAPSVLIALLVPVLSPEHTGALFAVVPIAAVMFFVAVVVGQFDFVDGTRRRRDLTQTLEWAESRLSALPPGSRRPVWPVLGVNAAVGFVLGTSVALLLRETSSLAGARSAWIPVAVCGSLALLVTVAAWRLAEGRYIARWPIERIALALAAALQVPVVLAILVLPIFQYPLYFATAIGGGVVVLVVGLSASRRLERVRGSYADWTVRGVAIRAAHHKVEHVRDRANHQLRALGPA